MEDRFVVVTGANGGLGRAVVQKLLDNGYNVFACDLTIDEEFTHERLLPIQIDVKNQRSINFLYNTIAQYTDVLYAVINLAGIYYMDSIVEGDEDKLREIIDVNFFGTYKVNKALLPFLEVDTSRIINVTSELAGYSPAPFNGYYSLSKLLVDSYTDIFRRELNYIGIRVVKVRSGSFSTNLFENVMKQYDSLIENTAIYKEQLEKLKSIMEKELQKDNNPEDFAKLILRIIKAKKPKICYNINRSRGLRLLNSFSEAKQDRIYKKKVQ